MTHKEVYGCFGLRPSSCATNTFVDDCSSRDHPTEKQNLLELVETSSISDGQCKPTIKRTSESCRHEGFGKRPMFTVEPARFTKSLWKTTAFLIDAYDSAFRPVVERLEDQDNVITNGALEQQFRSCAQIHTPARIFSAL